MSFNLDLINDIAQGNVVLFLGSGVSSSAETASGRKIKGWDQFLRFVSEKLDKNHKEIMEERLDQKDYLIACEIAKMHIDINDWQNLLYDEFLQKAEPSALHKAIVQLDQRVIITTNFDKLIENTFPLIDIETREYPIVKFGIDRDAFKMLRDRRKYIFKLHGSIDDPENIIFSKSDYASKAFSNWIYSDFIKLTLLTYTVLFIGFSMEDPAISLLIEQYVQSFPNTRPHYIILRGPINQSIEQISKNLRKLQIITYANADGHEALPALLDELHSAAQTRRKEILAEMTVRWRTDLPV